MQSISFKADVIFIFNIKVFSSFLYTSGATANKNRAEYLWRRRGRGVPTMPTKRSIHHARWLFLRGISNNPINQGTPPVQLRLVAETRRPNPSRKYCPGAPSPLRLFLPLVSRPWYRVLCIPRVLRVARDFSLSLSLSSSHNFFSADQIFFSPLCCSPESGSIVPWEQTSTDFGGFNCHRGLIRKCQPEKASREKKFSWRASGDLPLTQTWRSIF